MNNGIEKRNSFLFAAGQGVSYTGTWLQNVVLLWLVYSITHSSFWVGIVLSLPHLTSAVFVCFGGIIADKFEKKPLLYLTQTVQMFQAFVLGFLTLHGYATLPAIIALSFLLGIASALDKPTRMAMIPLLVSKDRVNSLISRSYQVHDLAKILGPVAASVLSLLFSPGWIFVINGISFLAILGTLPLLKVRKNGNHVAGSPVKLFFEGLRYIVSEKALWVFVMLAGLMAICNLSFRAILPNIATQFFAANSGTFDILFGAAALGSIVGVSLVKVVYRVNLRPYLIAGGCVLMGASLLSLALANFVFSPLSIDIAFGLFLMFSVGVGFGTSSIVPKIAVQEIASEDIIGRSSSVMFAVTNGGIALGQFAIGGLAASFGLTAALCANGAALVLLAGFAYLATRKR